MKNICLYSGKLLLVLVLLLSINLKSQNPVWKNYDFADYPLGIDFEGKYVWIASFDGLFRFDRTNEEIINFNHNNSDLPTSNLSCVRVDRNGKKWIGMVNSGLASFNDTTWRVFDFGNFNYVKCISLDKENNKWIGLGGQWNAGGGIRVIKDSIILSNYQMSNSGISDNDISSIAIEGEKVWTSGNYGLNEYNGTAWQNYNIGNSEIAYNVVKAVAIDKDNNKWIGTTNGLSKFDGITGWTTYLKTNSGLPNDDITCITTDTIRDVIWIGTQGGGLVKFDGDSWTVFDLNNSEIADKVIKYIAVDDSANVWIATGGGLSVYNENGVALAVKQENSINNYLKACPNPADKELSINYRLDGKINSIRIFDVLGKEVSNKELSNSEGRFIIDTSGFENGLYLIRTINSKTSYTKKFVVRH